MLTNKKNNKKINQKDHMSREMLKILISMYHLLYFIIVLKALRSVKLKAFNTHFFFKTIFIF